MSKSTLVINEENTRVIDYINDKMQKATEVKILVAFITMSGVSAIKEKLLLLNQKGIKCIIITGDYQCFTQPKALEFLNTFSNVEVRMIKDKCFHMKGYIFEVNNRYDMLIGSSNLTQNALTTNEELNVEISAFKDESIANDVINKFNKIYDESLSYEQFIDVYKDQYIQHKNKNIVEVKSSNNIMPNYMQQQALKNLAQVRDNGGNKALVISATGTGKTIISALDVKSFKAKRILFIVHRENIAKAALNTYKQLMPEKDFGLYTGQQKQEANYLFCTIQSLVINLDKFNREEFEYIIFDEIHHGGAKTYQKVLNYFNPQFLLGLTATPQRSDNFNIFEIFDYNIASEINLKQAYEHNLLTPFHYFGVADISLYNERELKIGKNVEYFINKTAYYGYDKEELKGLIFVANQKEALDLQQQLNTNGYKVEALIASSSERLRQDTINKLENGDLHYIITVDIFNEGVDIPSVNQVVLLRPTESAIIYTQQIGRALRKYKEKDYVVIIDFIGNYKNNFLIPIALMQDSSYEKDKLKQLVNGMSNQLISPNLIINFEQIAKEIIIKNIDQSNFSKVALIRKDFEYLRKKLNRIPSLVDFEGEDIISPLRILEASKTYLELKIKLLPKDEIRELNKIVSNQELMLFLEYFSQKITPAKRIDEVLIIERLLKNEISQEQLIKEIKKEYQTYNQERFDNALRHLQKEIFKKISFDYKFKPLVIESNNTLSLINEVKEAYLNNTSFKSEVDDLIRLNKSIYFKKYHNNSKELIQIGSKYTKQEAFKYLLLDFNNSHQVSGYSVFPAEKKALIFITLDDDKYTNIFKDNQLSWYSKESRKLTNKDGALTQEGLIANNKVQTEVFIKEKSEKEYKYIGFVKAVETVGISGKFIECIFRV